MSRRNARRYACRNEILTKEPREKSLEDFAGLVLNCGGALKDINNELMIAELDLPDFQYPDDTAGFAQKAAKCDDMCSYIRNHYLSGSDICHCCSSGGLFSNDNIGLERQVVTTLLHSSIKKIAAFFPKKEQASVMEEKFHAYTNLNEGKWNAYAKPLYAPTFRLMYRMMRALFDSGEIPHTDAMATASRDVLEMMWNKANPEYATDGLITEEYRNVPEILGNELEFVLKKNSKMMISPEELNTFFFGEVKDEQQRTKEEHKVIENADTTKEKAADEAIEANGIPIYQDDEILFTEEDFILEETRTDTDEEPDIYTFELEPDFCLPIDQEEKALGQKIASPKTEKKSLAGPDMMLFAFPELSLETARKYTMPSDPPKREEYAIELINACTYACDVAIEAVSVKEANAFGFLLWPSSFSSPVFVPLTDQKGIKMISGVIRHAPCRKIAYCSLPVYHMCECENITIRNLYSVSDYRKGISGPADAFERMSLYHKDMSKIKQETDEDEVCLQRAYARFLYPREGPYTVPVFTYQPEYGFVYDRYVPGPHYMYMNVTVRNVSATEWAKSVNALMTTLEKHATFDKNSARLCYLDRKRQLMVFETEPRDARAFASVIGRQFLRILEVTCVDTPTCILTQNPYFLK